jgi:hypothetical protein
MVLYHVQQIFFPLKNKKENIIEINIIQLTCSTLISIAGKRLRSLLIKSPSSLVLTVFTLCVSSPFVEILQKKKEI